MTLPADVFMVMGCSASSADMAVCGAKLHSLTAEGWPLMGLTAVATGLRRLSMGFSAATGRGTRGFEPELAQRETV